MAQYIDWFNIMTYDFHGSWENQANHQAALFGNPQDPSSTASRYFADYAIQHYIALGVPSSKIVMGAPIYGRGWAGVKSTNNGLFQSASGASSGTWEAGVFDYKDLLQKTQSQPSTYVLHWDSSAQVPYIYAPSV
jgi:chitinase